ncbi:hypothetical protein [Pikeienuella sp. HZG-20]|uniref:hypothetical protein n=1 Tax=Paludibacillus litoralis TaxID=3133267 RepID=UPI0030EDF6B6
MIDHIELIEAYMDCVELVRVSGLSSDRFTALAGLFLRTFDALSHCTRAALSGNYSGSAMYARDLLETHFLINYLMDQPGRPEEWLRSDPQTIRKKYRPMKIREYLDARDGFKEQKRRRHYEVLSVLGSHPTPSALDLKRDGTKAINSGPFKQANMLKNCIQEAAKAAFLLSRDLITFCNGEVPQGQSRASRLALARQRSCEKYLGSSTDHGG